MRVAASIIGPVLWYDLRTMRRITYRNAVTALFFAGAWFVLGFLFLLTPIPNGLGIGSELFQAWLVIFVLAFGFGGFMLTMASFNGLFPPVVKPPKRPSAPLSSSAATRTTRQAASWQRPTSSAPATRRSDH